MFKNPVLHCVATCYNWFVKGPGNLQSLFLLWMRLTWGHQFILAGTAKLPELVGWVELVGGAMLSVGFASRLVAVPLAALMIHALSLVHAQAIEHFRFITDPSSLVHEAPYPFLITSLLVLFFGPGRISLDAWLKRWANKQPRY